MVTSTLDLALRAIGATLAGVSVAFAGFMLAYGGGEVRVFGMEHLAIFAQPRGSAIVRPPSAPPEKQAAVDMAAIGSVADLSPRPPQPLRPDIVAARSDRVWLRIDGKIVPVAPGQVVAGLGKIATIVHRDGGWAALDEKGATLLAIPDPANAARLFTRRLMFE